MLPPTTSIEYLAATALPKGCRPLNDRDQLQALGTGWLRESRTGVLAVPSAVVPAELNFLINPLHADFSRIAVGEPEALDTDLRLIRDVNR